MKSILDSHYVARQHFLNNPQLYPQVKYWTDNNIIWVMHHWDTSLKKLNPHRYDLWLIEDLVPMTREWHNVMHTTNHRFINYMRKKHLKSTSYWRGKKRPIETRQKISQSLIGNIPWNKGKTNVYSEDTLRKMSEAKIGRIPWNKGIPRSEETKEKLRKANLGKKYSDEVNKSKGRPGHIVTQETRDKISAKNSGELNGMYGKHHTDERKAYLSDNNPKNKKVICLETGEVFDSISKAAKTIHKSPETVSSVCRGKTNTAGGYHWAYYIQEDTLDENK